MKIGILQCDHVLEKFVSEHGTYPQMYSALFDNVQLDVQFELYDVTLGEYPLDIDECDAYITTGSKCGVNDDLSWLEGLENFVLKLHQAKKKFVGICFGHQLVAKALGGRVELSPKGWGIGLSFNQIDARKSWMRPYSEGMDLVVSHQDQVVVLPAQAQVLASSDFCPYYMIQYEEHFLTIQGHPEFPKGYSESLMDDRRNRIPARRIREGMVSLLAETNEELCAIWIYKFFSTASK
ncbi:glutamine amidotransferase-related protein [Amphritea sp. HPY]|uniref:glutamine amidotransferase-related protein n=1 Tax=Amphritea sp. HPY TaxID=3421652 RepID=UPI003D7C7BEC